MKGGFVCLGFRVGLRVSRAFGRVGPLAPGLGLLLGGPLDPVTTCNWAYNPTYNPPKWVYTGYPNYK